MAKLRGIFPVLQTPLDASDRIDDEALARQVDFAVACGAHGVVYPVLGSEFQYLTDGERRCLVELVVRQAAKRTPVVVGVAATTGVGAAEYAAHARAAGADAVVALPPYIAGANREELFAYYAGVAEAAQCPVMIQHSFAGLDSALLSRLLTEIEHVRYVKEEMAPSAHHISGVVQGAGEECWGVFGGALGRWMISEMRRGAVGFMPAAEVTDVYAISQQQVLGYTPDVYDAFLTFDSGMKVRVKAEWIKHIDELVEFYMCFSGHKGTLIYNKRGGFGTEPGWRANLPKEIDAEALLGHQEALSALGANMRAMFHRPEPMAGALRAGAMGRVPELEYRGLGYGRPMALSDAIIAAILGDTLEPDGWEGLGPLPTHEDGLAQTRITDAIIRSADCGEPVSL